MKIEEAGHISDKVVEILREERVRRKISQYQLAKGCGLSKTSIAFIERFENKPTLRTLVMIADYLKVDLGQAVTDSIAGKTAQENKKSSLSSFEKK